MSARKACASLSLRGGKRLLDSKPGGAYGALGLAKLLFNGLQL